ncbi:MAG: cupredoxin domain-containing protein [Dehalococcoidia bacterium]|nr:cupredoxin domain-containing protein [Dehalococcoidia bacterium]
MPKRTTWLALGLAPALAATLVFAACGGDDDDTTDSTSTTQATGTATSGNSDEITEVPEGAPLIDQDNLKFIPTSLEVAVGTKVYFKNSETAIHTVTVDGKNITGNMRKDDIYVWTPNAAGSYKLTCDFHPQMKATVTVK